MLLFCILLLLLAICHFAVQALDLPARVPLTSEQKNVRARPLATDNPLYTCDECKSYTKTGSNCASSCYSCGYGDDYSRADSCVTCPTGDYLTVVWTDCTGMCTGAVGSRPPSNNSCNLMCAHCGFPYHPFVATTSCNSDYCSTNSFTSGCFEGNTTYGKCHRCGFTASIGTAANANDCVTCGDGYEIDVVYSDCTGFCVLAGTAVNPISKTSCKMPCTACGTTYDGFVSAAAGRFRITFGLIFIIGTLTAALTIM